MPQENTLISSYKPKTKRSTSKHFLDQDGSQFLHNTFSADFDGESVLPPAFKVRLQELFYQIEKEFETLYLENVTLQEKIERLHEKLEREEFTNEKLPSENTDVESVSNSVKSLGKPKFASQQKLKTAHKLKAQTSKIVSSFKTPAVNCSMVKEFVGHKDGIWDVEVAHTDQRLIGTASAGKFSSNVSIKSYVYCVQKKASARIYLLTFKFQVFGHIFPLGY